MPSPKAKFALISHARYTIRLAMEFFYLKRLTWSAQPELFGWCRRGRAVRILCMPSLFTLPRSCSSFRQKLFCVMRSSLHSIHGKCPTYQPANSRSAPSRQQVSTETSLGTEIQVSFSCVMLFLSGLRSCNVAACCDRRAMKIAVTCRGVTRNRTTGRWEAHVWDGDFIRPSPVRSNSSRSRRSS